MQHRYIVWEGRYKGRLWKEMHIIASNNKPICGMWKSASTTDEAIWHGRPDGYHLCQNCRRKRADFEQREKIRTWQQLAEAE